LDDGDPTTPPCFHVKNVVDKCIQSIKGVNDIEYKLSDIR